MRYETGTAILQVRPLLNGFFGLM